MLLQLFTGSPRAYGRAPFFNDTERLRIGHSATRVACRFERHANRIVRRRVVLLALSRSVICLRPDGGIGRRTGLKILCPVKGRAGSIPAPATLLTRTYGDFCDREVTFKNAEFYKSSAFSFR